MHIIMRKNCQKNVMSENQVFKDNSKKKNRMQVILTCILSISFEIRYISFNFLL